MQNAHILNALTKLQPYKSDQVKVQQRSCQGRTLSPVSNWLPHRLNFQKLLKGTEHPFGGNCFKMLCHGAWKGWRRAERKDLFLSVLCSKLIWLFFLSKKFVSIVWILFGWLLSSPFPKGMAGKKIHWKNRKTSTVLQGLFSLKKTKKIYTPPGQRAWNQV